MDKIKELTKDLKVETLTKITKAFEVSIDNLLK
jgi:hypothetical protein